MKKLISMIMSNFKSIKAKGAFHILMGSFAVKFVTLFGSIFIVRLLTKDEYGTLAYIENICSYAGIFVGLGLANATLRFSVITENKNEKFGIYKFILKNQSVFNFFLVLAVIIFAFFYPHPSQYEGIENLMIIYALYLPFDNVFNTNLIYERSEFNNSRYAIMSIFVASMSVGFRVIGAGFFGLTGTVAFKVASDIICCIVIIFLVYNRYFKKIEPAQIHKSKKKEIYKFSINNMIANGIWVLFMLTDVFLIGRMINDAATLADYKVAYVLPSNLAIITSTIAIFITPYFVKNEKNRKWVKKNYLKVMAGNFSIVAVLALLMYVLAEFLVTVLYGEQYLNVVPLMRILIVAHLVNAGIQSVNGGLLTAMGHPDVYMKVAGVSFVLQVALAIYVLPRFGTMGLAYTTLVVYILMSVTVVLLFCNKFNIFTKNIEEE